MSSSFLYLEPFDFRPFGGEPKIVVCMLFVPRSGSTFLACLMRQTMNLGFPLEYFGSLNLRILSERLPGFSITNPSPLIRVRTSSNGTFSFKLNNRVQAEHKETLIEKLGVTHFLFVDRKNRETQARSFAIASLTKQWVLQAEEHNIKVQEPAMSQILECKKTLQQERDSIQNFISKRPEKTLYLEYEDFIEKPQISIDKIGSFLDIKNDIKVDINNVPIKKQS